MKRLFILLLSLSTFLPRLSSATVYSVDDSVLPQAKQQMTQLGLVAAPETQKKPTWTLNAGDTVGKDLEGWGTQAGWRVVWQLEKDWSVPASTAFTGDFEEVSAAVIKTLAKNGAIIHAEFFRANKTVVITGPGNDSQTQQ